MLLTVLRLLMLIHVHLRIQFLYSSSGPTVCFHPSLSSSNREGSTIMYVPLLIHLRFINTNTSFIFFVIDVAFESLIVESVTSSSGTFECQTGRALLCHLLHQPFDNVPVHPILVLPSIYNVPVPLFEWAGLFCSFYYFDWSVDVFADVFEWGGLVQHCCSCQHQQSKSMIGPILFLVSVLYIVPSPSPSVVIE